MHLGKIYSVYIPGIYIIGLDECKRSQCYRHSSELKRIRAVTLHVSVIESTVGTVMPHASPNIQLRM